MKNIFRKHLTQEQINVLNEHINLSSVRNIGLGQKTSHKCSIMFCDLCNFTNISWGLEPDVILNILQEFFQYCSEKIVYFKGMIDKYPGDGIVSFFPHDFSDDKYNVVEQSIKSACIIMDWFYDDFKPRHQSKLEKCSHELNLKIGIDAGFIYIAHVGSPYHSELILFGNQVNVASKCQEKGLEKEIIIGQEAKEIASLPSVFFDQGPSTDIVYSKTNKHYLSFRFDWEGYLKIFKKFL